MKQPPSRRLVLRGLLGGGVASLALPWLEALSGHSRIAHAGDSGFPVRFCLFYWGNGNLPETWTPEQDGEDFSLTEQMLSLEALQHKICLVTGMSVKVPNVVPHIAGAAGLLSCQPVLQEEEDTFAGPSIDQIIASAAGGETLYRSLETAATNASALSYTAPYSRNPPETDPFALYSRLFGDTFREPGSEGLVDPTLGLRRSVLDAVMGDIQSLQNRVSATDRERLEQHLDGVRQLETRLALLEEDPPNLESCQLPETPTGDYGDIEGRPQIADRNAVISQLLAMAMACDQTRVVSHYLSDPVNNELFPEATAGHHELTHNEPGDQPEVHAITTFCVEQFASFLQALDDIPEGDGTLLDHCSVLGCTEVSKGQTHSLDDIPLILAGGADGFFKTGYHHHSVSLDNATKVMLTLMHSMGITQSSLGSEDAYADSLLSEILL